MRVRLVLPLGLADSQQAEEHMLMEMMEVELWQPRQHGQPLLHTEGGSDQTLAT